MKMPDETAIIDLNQDFLGSSLLLCPVYGNIDHGEPVSFKVTDGSGSCSRLNVISLFPSGNFGLRRSSKLKCLAPAYEEQETFQP